MIKQFLVCAQLLFLLQLPFSLQAQDIKGPKFGEVSSEELSMKVYERDRSAQAVVLFDISDMDYLVDDAHFQAYLKRHVRIKVLGEQGVHIANISLPVDWSNEGAHMLRNLEAVTYNQENGVVTETKLDVSQVSKHQDGSRMLYKFTMPNVRQGSVIEFTYSLVSDYRDNLQPWEYQGEYPVIRAVCRMTIPGCFKYKFRAQGSHPFAVDKSEWSNAQYHYDYSLSNNKDDISYWRNLTVRKVLWEVHDVPAMKSEPLMAPLTTLLGRMDFQLEYIKWMETPGKSIAESWNIVEDRLLSDERFREDRSSSKSNYLAMYINGNYRLNRIAQQAMEAGSDIQARVSKAVALIREQVKWDGSREVGASKSINKVLKEGNGNSTAQNLLLLTTLREMGMMCWPMLVPDRNGNALELDFPNINFAREVLVLVRIQNNKYMVVDVSDEALPIGMVPPRCQNGMGWVIRSGVMAPWYRLETTQPGETKVTASLKIGEDGALSGQVRQELNGYAAYRIRKEGRITEELVDRMLELNAGKLSDLQVTHEQDVQQPLQLGYQIAIAPGEQVRLTDNTLYLQPLLAYLSNLEIFRLPQREYAVDLGLPMHHHYTVNFELPEGYVLNTAPDTISMSLSDKSACLVYSSSQVDNILSVSCQLQFNKVRYQPSEYTALREFAIRVSAKLQEMVSLQKVKQ